MLGIGLPELIVIFAVALIVVGPEKLPELAKSLAKMINELKSTVNQVKDELADGDNGLNDVKTELQQTSKELQRRLMDAKTSTDLGHLQNDSEEDIIDIEATQEREWEKDRKKRPDSKEAEQEEKDNSDISEEKGNQAQDKQQS